METTVVSKSNSPHIPFNESEFAWNPNALQLDFKTKSPHAKKNQVSIMRLTLKADEQPKLFWDFEDSNRMIQFMVHKISTCQQNCRRKNRERKQLANF